MLYDVRKEGVMPTMYDEQGRRIDLPYTPEGMAKAAAARKKKANPSPMNPNIAGQKKPSKKPKK